MGRYEHASPRTRTTHTRTHDCHTNTTPARPHNCHDTHTHARARTLAAWQVYENLDANFNVVFARVVIEGRSKALLPPPLNLLRRLVLIVYSAAHSLIERTGCNGKRGWTRHLDAAADDDEEEGEEEEEEEEVEAAVTRAEEAGKVQEFIEKAISAKVFPEGVEEYVRRHRHDIAEEHQWRVGLTKQVSAVLLGVTKQASELYRPSTHCPSACSWTCTLLALCTLAASMSFGADLELGSVAGERDPTRLRGGAAGARAAGARGRRPRVQRHGRIAQPRAQQQRGAPRR